MPDRFEDLDFDGTDGIGGSGEPIKTMSDITIQDVVKWMWQHKLQQVKIDPTVKDGKIALIPTLTKFPKTWKQNK